MSDQPEAKYLRIIILFKFQSYEVDTSIFPILQIGELRYWKIK